MKFTYLKITVLLTLTAALAGCVNSPPAKPTIAQPASVPRVRINKEFDNHLAAAKKFYDEQNWDACILQCAEMFRLDPTDPELQQLYQAARAAQMAARAAHLATASKTAHEQLRLETKEKETLPPTYGTRRPVEPRPETLKIAETPAERLLSRPITMNLENAELAAILEELSKNAGVQFIADQSIIEGKRINVRVENAPLKEILDYITRNLPVSFYAGENILWVTAQEGGDQKSLQPMETKIYHLRKGIVLPEADSIQPSESIGGGTSGVSNIGRRASARASRGGLLGNLGNLGRLGGLTGGGASGGGGGTNLEAAIAAFVETPPGSNLLYDKQAHVIIARNTRENLRALEQIIEALDVTPQQVLIEARFVEVGVNDLRELGVEWILGEGGYAITRRAGGRTETRIDAGKITSFPTPAVTPGGFNLTYTGVLTDPMFQAVLHVLQQSGKSRTIAVPRVTTVNNHPARIRIGQDFRYFEQFERQSVLSSVTGVGGTPVYTNELVPVGTPTLEELGISLDVLPSVGADSDAIMLTLAPQNKDFVRFESFSFGSDAATLTSGTLTGGSAGTIKMPIFTVSEIQTRVVVRSGETVVMGGLVRTSTQREVSKVPLLGDLPLVGAAFRRESNNETRSNLLIFVTATLIGYSGESLVPVK